LKRDGTICRAPRDHISPPFFDFVPNYRPPTRDVFLRLSAPPPPVSRVLPPPSPRESPTPIFDEHVIFVPPVHAHQVVFHFSPFRTGFFLLALLFFSPQAFVFSQAASIVDALIFFVVLLFSCDRSARRVWWRFVFLRHLFPAIEKGGVFFCLGPRSLFLVWTRSSFNGFSQGSSRRAIFGILPFALLRDFSLFVSRLIRSPIR